jgi:hypothetical protein
MTSLRPTAPAECPTAFTKAVKQRKRRWWQNLIAICHGQTSQQPCENSQIRKRGEQPCMTTNPI